MDLIILKAWLNTKFAKTERGASMVEYGLLIALIAVIAVVAVTALGNNTSKKFSSSASSLS